MRISDWSSDVCSSDLPPRAPARSAGFQGHDQGGAQAWLRTPPSSVPTTPSTRGSAAPVSARAATTAMPPPAPTDSATITSGRSKEHTSELQSLMRLSYAVFCLQNQLQCVGPLGFDGTARGALGAAAR